MNGQIYTAYREFIATVEALIVYAVQKVPNPAEREPYREAVLQECDNYLQGVMLHIAIADGVFSLDEGVAICGLTRRGNILSEGEMYAYTYQGTAGNGRSVQARLLPNLLKRIADNTSNIPTFWDVAVILEKQNAYLSCQKIKEQLENLLVQFILVDGEYSSEEMQVCEKQILPLIRFANENNIYFNGYKPDKLVPDVSDDDQKYYIARTLAEKEEFERAFFMYNELARKGHLKAQYDLARCYDQGLGTTKCATLAFQWYLKAAEGGMATAMNDVAVCYMTGDGVVQSRGDGIIWYQKAAVLNDVQAQSNLAANFYQIYQVTKDYDLLQKAFYWSDRAARSGDARATTLRATILPMLEKN